MNAARSLNNRVRKRIGPLQRLEGKDGFNAFRTKISKPVIPQVSHEFGF
jgi:hypothetical protein